MKKRLVFVIMIIGICLCAAGFFLSGIFGKHSPIAEQKSKGLRKAILAEIESLEDHDWAGEYYHGDGLGVNVSLLIAPKSGYLFEWHGCLGLYDRNYGKVTVKDGKIKLSFTYPNTQEGFQGIAEEFFPVSWGERKYLISPEDIIEFCNDVNSKSEPRNDLHGMHLLKRGDHTKDVTGDPDIPQEYKKYLLKQPITAEIVSVGKPTVKTGAADIKFKTFPVVLNTGKKSGLLAGMELHAADPNILTSSIIITEVQDQQSKGTITQTGEYETPPQVGWKLSTVMWWQEAIMERRKEQEK